MIKKLLKRVVNILNGNDIETLKKNGLKVGSKFQMLRGCIIDPSHCWLIEIGNNVTFAPNVHILAHDASTKKHLGYTKIANVKIKDNVFIGTSCTILPGVTIGENSIIAAGSVVTRNVQNNSVYGGSPAKFIISLDEYIDGQRSKMYTENTFDKSFTVNGKITTNKKIEMFKKLDKYGNGFVI